jgi:hypothetical protein
LNQNIRIFISEYYNLNKKDLWLLLGCNAALGLLLRSYEFHAFIQAAVVVIMCWYNFSFLRKSSIMPSISSDFDRYSWKYFQGLPLNKEELLISLVLTNLIAMFPIVFWAVAFLDQLASLFTEQPQLISWMTILKTFLCSFPVLLYLSLNAIKNLITYPRKQYSKVDPKIRNLNYLKNASIIGVIGLYGLIVLENSPKLIHKNMFFFLSDSIQIMIWISKSWLLLPVLCIFVFMSYHNVLRIWQNESRAYVHIDWKPKRDISITGFCMMLFFGTFVFIDFEVPHYYSHDKLLTAIYKKDYLEVSRSVQNQININRAGSNGITPLMAAALEGNLKIYNLLISKGAKLDGEINLPNNPKDGMNIFMASIEGNNLEIVKGLLSKGLSPDEFSKRNKNHAIHVAAANCRTEILDLLIEKKANLNAQNSNGETALHLATKDRCFTSVALLLEAGVNAHTRDSSNKTALEYVGESRYGKDLAFYIEKKSRKPAGVL